MIFLRSFLLFLAVLSPLLIIFSIGTHVCIRIVIYYFILIIFTFFFNIGPASLAKCSWFFFIYLIIVIVNAKFWTFVIGG